MSLHPAYDALRKHGVRFFTNVRDWTDDCLECGNKNSLSVRYNDDVAEFRCEACGRSGSERLRQAPEQNLVEEARKEFPGDGEPDQSKSDIPE